MSETSQNDLLPSTILQGENALFEAINGKEGFSHLMQAAYQGKADLCKTLLMEGGVVDEKDRYGYSALSWSARRGHIMTCDVLINGGASIDSISKFRNTPLIRAAHAGHAGILRMLCAAGASVFLSDENKMSALHWAASRGGA